MQKILIIPHHPLRINLKIRLIEIAKSLARNYSVYLVNWSAAEERSSLRARLSSAIKDIFAQCRHYRRGQLTVVEFPMLHRPLFLAPAFNSLGLKKIIKKEKIELVINGSYYMFNIPKIRAFKYILDIADVPVQEKLDAFDRFVSRQVAIESEKADAITVSSKGLKNYVSKNYEKGSIFIPNGADLARLRSVSDEKIKQIRQRYNLMDKWVIGYIGNIGTWVDLDLVTSAFKEIKKNIQNAVLFLVGLCPDSDKEKFSSQGIVFTGGIASVEIDDYFSVIDLGVIPSKKSLFQDLAFHVKAIEYTAARKFIVATPSQEMKSLDFPNIIFAESQKDAWVEAIQRARTMGWDGGWDSLVDEYDWSKISQQFIDCMGIKNA
jgi:glycosyltransferase involved in cell wall biosynthesis